MRALATLAATYALVLLLLAVVHVAWPQRDGILALTQIAAPHLFLLLAGPLVIVVLARRRAPVLMVLLAIAVGLGRFGPGMLSLPRTHAPDERTLDVAAWNLGVGELSGERLVGRLIDSDAEVVSLEELRSEHVLALESSAALVERFPHRMLRPHDGVLGMGLLSAYPMRLASEGRDPPHVKADVEIAPMQLLTVLAAHPLPPAFARVLGTLPISYTTVERDDDLRWLRTLIQPDLNASKPVLLLGDLNVTDREPGYWDVASGLVDAHLEVGIGPGSTWRPGRLAALPLGVLRIDYVFAGGAARPLSIATDCTPDGGDHCLVEATIGVSSGE